MPSERMTKELYKRGMKMKSKWDFQVLPLLGKRSKDRGMYTSFVGTHFMFVLDYPYILVIFAVVHDGIP